MSTFSITTKVFFGTSAVTEFCSFMRSRNLSRVVLIVDKNITKNPHIDHLVSNLKNNGFSIALIKDVYLDGEPTYSSLDSFTEDFRQLNMDALIAIGGGSVLDLVKGAGVLLKNPGKGIDYRGMDKVENAGVPVICFPATAGTGSEVTHTASFVDTVSMTKLGINGRFVAPLCGVLVPELTFSCPQSVTVYSGLDAMLHAVEAVTSKTANTITKKIGCEAFALMYNNFLKVIKFPDDYTAREEMLLGSYLAAIAMMNAGGGPSGGISYPLGVHFKVPHGIAGGIFLPYVFEHNIRNGCDGYLDIYNLFYDADHSLDDKNKLHDFVKKIQMLYREIDAPEKLTCFGVSKTDIDFLVEQITTQMKGNLERNPVDFGKDDVRSILEKVLV